MMESFNYPGTIPNADYSIIGTSAFSKGTIGTKYYGINIESILLNCQGNCSSSCITKASCTQLSGISKVNDCFICPNNTKFNETRKACISNCSMN